MRLPKHLIESGLDMNEVDDVQVSDLIDENFAYWDELLLCEQDEIVCWWADIYGQFTDGFYDGDDDDLAGAEWISDSELIQYLTEQGYLIR